MHAQELENQADVGSIITLFRDRWNLPPDGIVMPEEFAAIKADLDKARRVFIKSAENEAEKELYPNLWPYQDTVI